MKPGSVIVDMAAEAGGNVAVTVPGQVQTVKGVSVIGTVFNFTVKLQKLIP